MEYIVRFGGLVSTYYVSDALSTCHTQEATRLNQQQAEKIAKEQGGRAIPT